ncbi:helix-turn-helix transcriptional regulator [Leptolyngbya sp. FACHB-16]|uniref:response regulator transcription factor n=1 Tax=unclassified Leptolyngbya TaxID=2650499 RepID=UPI001684B290|nr:helix-turn-helix transcriptional regulator [Leptolyngbya sp. FACHB-16]MBD2158542.1 hypothetical protein [Leptolyngbya sp. FACHB-16]
MTTTLTVQDHQKILDFLHGIYTLDSLQNFPAYVLNGIAKLVPADIPVYTSIDFANAQLFTVEGTIPNFSNLYKHVQQHFYDHPFAERFSNLDFTAYKLSDFLTEEQLKRSEVIYQNCLRLMGMEETMSFALPQTLPISSSIKNGEHIKGIKFECINLFRSQRNFTERDRLVLNTLHPHLTQIRQTAQVFFQIKQENVQLYDSFNAAGGVLLSKEGHIQFMSHKAERWLKQYFSFSCSGKLLPEYLQQWVKYQLSLFLESESSLNPRLPLVMEQEGKRLTIRFATEPNQEQYVLLLEEQRQPQLSIESFKLIGLSAREAEVLYWVAKGKENLEIAELLYISAATVRKHLERIYLKLEAKTRTAAVVAALEKLGLIN